MTRSSPAQPAAGAVTRLAIIDDHVVVARGLAADLTPDRAGMEAVAVARTVAELLELGDPSTSSSSTCSCATAAGPSTT